MCFIILVPLITFIVNHQSITTEDTICVPLITEPCFDSTTKGNRQPWLFDVNKTTGGQVRRERNATHLEVSDELLAVFDEVPRYSYKNLPRILTDGQHDDAKDYKECIIGVGGNMGCVLWNSWDDDLDILVMESDIHQIQALHN